MHGYTCMHKEIFLLHACAGELTYESESSELAVVHEYLECMWLCKAAYNCTGYNIAIYSYMHSRHLIILHIAI